jgi:hypothetical protein
MKILRRSVLKYLLFLIIALPLTGLLLRLIQKAHDQNKVQRLPEMKKLIVSKIQYENSLNIEIAEKMLEQEAELQLIETINWIDYPYKPDVKFRIAYCQNQILLKYYVTEESIRAKASEVNDDVYKDSCVEFFISTKSNSSYYNFEFSCIGIPNASYGIDRHNRELIDSEILKLIQVRSSLGNQPFEEKTGGHSWELMLVIPADCLVEDKDINLEGLIAKANFYKCGDETVIPHFVSWNPISTEQPDFHKPACFGEISFD